MRLHAELFDPLQSAAGWLAEGDSGEPLIRAADKDLYCLIRSDILLVDLSAPGYGEQGIDLLCGHMGGMPTIGITDRFQNAPSLLARLDCLICPDSVGQIVRAIELFGGRAKAPASSESNESVASTPTQPATGTPEVSAEFAASVLQAAGRREVKTDAIDEDDQRHQVP